MTHEFNPDHYCTTLGWHEPVLRVADGDTIKTQTLCAHGTDASGRRVVVGGNPQTGPFFVEGAFPGHVLAVHFDRIWPSRDSGWTCRRLAPNVLEPEFLSTLDPAPDPPYATWHIDRQKGTTTLTNTGTKLDGFTLPLDPMLGCFGVAPANDEAIGTGTSGRHGGNMDYRGFRVGTTVYLPVFVKGALFFLGDGHAVQGDGEIIGTGVETPMEVTFTVRVLKDRTITWPHGEDDTFYFTVGNARPLDQALQHATSEMVRWLEAAQGLNLEEASYLLGECVAYDIGNVYDPAYTVVCKIPKARLP